MLENADSIEIKNETAIMQDEIIIKELKIIAPDNTLILANLNLKISQFNSVMIIGESGVGKSSI